MSAPLSEACGRVERALEQGEPVPTDDVRLLVTFARSKLLPAPARRKPPRIDSGLTPAEREALRKGLLAARLPGDWPMRKKHTAGVGHLLVSGELGHSIRIYQRRALYLVHRDGFAGEHDLGVFTGEGWIEALVQAIVAVFDRISPKNAGWAEGQRARDRKTGQIFEVRLVRNLVGPPRHWANASTIELFDGAGRRHLASDCVREDGA
jgi:hypothetical protein